MQFSSMTFSDTFINQTSNFQFSWLNCVKGVILKNVCISKFTSFFVLDSWLDKTSRLMAILKGIVK